MSNNEVINDNVVRCDNLISGFFLQGLTDLYSIYSTVMSFEVLS